MKNDFGSRSLGDGPDRHPLARKQIPGIHEIKAKNRERIVAASRP
jgi:hypothetical protein